jgi:PIN domain nuclease of toxin-antitoxin system
LIVLDTHTLLWRMLEPERLSTVAGEAIANAPERAISAITFQEVAYLVARRRVDLYKPVGPWLVDALGALEGVALPATVSVALRAGALDPQKFHGDPIDRLIYATVVEHDAQLVTADGRLREFDPERTVW